MKRKSKFKCGYDYIEWSSIQETNNRYDIFERFKFNHPLYILYSSGTTGIPKCIVHGAGGSLIQHKKSINYIVTLKKTTKYFTLPLVVG